VKVQSIVFWCGLALALAAANVLMHKRGNETAGSLIGIMGMTPYLWTARALGVAGLLMAILALGRNLMQSPARFKTFLVFLPVAVILDLSLISVPIERIHYVQYGVLTWLAYKGIGKPLPAAIFAFVVNILDEAYQYWVLYAEPRHIYFDWNDIVLNLVGILIVLLFFLPEPEGPRRVPAKPMVAAVILWTVTAVLVVAVLNPDRYLVRDDPYSVATGAHIARAGSFWITSNINTNYHVMNTLEGLASLGVMVILMVGYHRRP